MHVTIPVLPSALASVETLLERIADLGGVAQYPCVLVSTGDVDLAKSHRLASSAFQSTSLFPVEMPHGHPNPANVLFARTALHMATAIGDAYLYLEPEARPTSPHWLKDLVASYREHNHRFMGKLEPLPSNAAEAYMLPTGIYPKDFWHTSDLLPQIPFDQPASQFLYGEIVYRGRAYDSGLFSTDAENRMASVILLAPTVAQRQVAPAVAEHGIDLINDGPARLEVNQDGISAVHNDLLQPTSAAVSHPAQSIADVYATTMAEQYPQGAPAPTYVPETFQPSPEYAEMVGAKMAPVHETAQWINDPRVLDATIPAPVATIPPAMEQPGTLDSYPSVGAGGNPVVVENAPPSPSQEGFSTVEQRNAAIRKDKTDGMPWRDLLSKYKLTPKVMKTILNEV